MKVSKLATALLISSVIPSKAKPIKITAAVNEIFISPFLLRGDTCIAVNVLVTKQSTINISAKIINDLYPSGVGIFSDAIKTSGVHYYHYDNSYTFGENNQIEITYQTPTRTETIKHYINVAKKGREYIGDDNHIIANYCTYRWNGNWSLGIQEYTFENFDDVYMPNFYQKIDISDFKVKVIGLGSEHFSTSGTFIFNNLDGMFQDLCAPGTKNYVKLPVSFELDHDNVYQLKFDIELFVNKQTLSMSREKKEGYLQTKYIYLPRNNMRHQEEIKCSISFEDFGVDKDYLDHSFTLKALNNVMGDCHNSEYCVIRK